MAIHYSTSLWNGNWLARLSFHLLLAISMLLLRYNVQGCQQYGGVRVRVRV